VFKTSFTRAVATATAVAMLLVFWPVQAEAQRRGPRRGRVTTSVVFVGGVSYPRFVSYDPWYYDTWYQWGPRRPYPPFGYYPYARYDLTASLRLEVKPREASVYVDGYLAGTVDDFDGFFQRLRVEPGGHVITVFLEGYRTVTENIHLGPAADRSLKFVMEPLAAGQIAEAPPAPGEVVVQEPPAEVGRPPRDEPRPVREAPQAFGTLAIQVQPADAEITVDGERWSAPAGETRVAIELPAGEHRVEVSKAGYASYVETVLILRGRTLSLNVSLKR